MSKQTRNLLTWATALLFCLIFRFVNPISLRAQSNLDSLSDQVAKGIKQEKKLSIFPKVVVMDFPNPATGIDALSAYLADQLSTSLEGKLPSGTIISRRKLADFLGAHRLSPLDMQSIFVAYWAADNLGANGILFGELSPSDSVVALDSKLLRIGTAKEAANWKAALPTTEEILAHRGKALDLTNFPEALKLALRCNSVDNPKVMEAFTKSGGTLPKAIRRANPPYSEEARKEKLSGARKYDVLINELGDVVLAIPHRPLRPEFDDITLQTMKSWKFQPATKGGKPVAVCAVFEVNWRLY
jgi:hypothetical protein